MKRIFYMFLIIMLFLVGIYVSKDKISIKTSIDTSVDNFDFNIILDEIISTTGAKYSKQHNYLITHWAPKFNIDITRNRIIKDLTLSLAMERKDSSYDIYQIRKTGKDILNINLLEKGKKFEELNNPVIADKILISLNNINWTDLFKKIPEAEFYTLKSWGTYKKGEKVEINSGVYHNLNPRIAYINKQDKIEEFSNYAKNLVNEIVLSAIVPMNRRDEGYSGKADIALIIELED